MKLLPTMTIINNPTTTTTTTLSRSSPSPFINRPFTDRFHFIITSPAPPTKLFFFSFNRGGALSTKPPTITLRCRCRSSSSSEEEEGGGGSLKEVISGMVDERVVELLNKQKNRVLLDGSEEATLRVQMAKTELSEFDRREFESKQAKEYINHLQSKASEIEVCQKEILEAREMVEEAGRALQSGGVGGTEALTAKEIEAINKNEDRLESIKAGAIAAFVGTLAELPFSLA